MTIDVQSPKGNLGNVRAVWDTQYPSLARGLGEYEVSRWLERYLIFTIGFERGDGQLIVPMIYCDVSYRTITRYGG